jgi:hypothetical protein
MRAQQRIAEPPDQWQRGGDRGQPERPRQRRIGRPHGRHHAAHRPQHLLGPRQHRLALRRQADEATVPLDQPLAQRQLQRREPG